jgi:hypothetical protein
MRAGIVYATYPRGSIGDGGMAETSRWESKADNDWSTICNKSDE